ncbi:cbb3-type cytochrome oxidase assembly protein CcoS [Geomonas propionica]|uniref:Cbb3-type cytochrome oxidase assembly protein CcoS n=1 Tax=Geomonas propionica TaxID=2798582 RepID=A0ABS0YKV0_9BACT|nr:cbb3-type cytochrome oxidase assembly protein CcoS [Geomonas propionica]MBJ6798574.1 cbb3-type cytochrome oxidase assembly protein CcoS [Geomonas propionica]
MNSALDTPAFLFIWMCFPLLMCGMLIVFFLWGVRSGQFADQERARYLALDSGIPEDGNSASNLSEDERAPLPTSPLRGKGPSAMQ